MADNFLTLSTERKRRPVMIDGKTYLMADRDELPLALVFGLGAIGAECAKAGSGALAESEVDALVGRVRASVKRFMIDLPDEVFAKLSDAHCLELLTAFCAAQAKPAPGAATEPAKEMVS